MSVLTAQAIPTSGQVQLAAAPAGQLVMLQVSGQSSYVIGVTAAWASAPLQLQLVSGSQTLTQQWILGMDGYVYSAADPSYSLVMDPGSISSYGAQIKLNYRLPGQTLQQWNWSGQSGMIINRGNTNMAVDNYGNRLMNGNPIISWYTNQTDPAEQWVYAAP